jgi:hypothetical protein
VVAPDPVAAEPRVVEVPFVETVAAEEAAEEAADEPAPVVACAADEPARVVARAAAVPDGAPTQAATAQAATAVAASAVRRRWPVGPADGCTARRYACGTGRRTDAAGPR